MDKVRYASVEDSNRLISFLEGAQLSIEGVEDYIEYFLIIEDESGKIRATLGIEPIQDIGLLRSLVVSNGLAEQDVIVLFNQMLKLAKDKSLNSLYLATNKHVSTAFFQMLGFVEAGQVPTELLGSKHGKYIKSVDNSIVMKITL